MNTENEDLAEEVVEQRAQEIIDQLAIRETALQLAFAAVGNLPGSGQTPTMIAAGIVAAAGQFEAFLRGNDVPAPVPTVTN